MKKTHHKPMQIDANDRGHGHVGAIMNSGMDNHQHGKVRKGVASSPKMSCAANPADHKTFNTREH